MAMGMASLSSCAVFCGNARSWVHPRLSVESGMVGLRRTMVAAPSVSVPARERSYSRPLLPPQASAYLVEKVTADELMKLLEDERQMPLVVDFFATWCGPCVAAAQDLEQLAVEYKNKVNFVKIDTDEEYELAQEMKIRGLPTVLFVSDDRDKNMVRTEGVLPLDTLRDIIDNEL